MFAQQRIEHAFIVERIESEFLVRKLGFQSPWFVDIWTVSPWFARLLVGRPLATVYLHHAVWRIAGVGGPFDRDRPIVPMHYHRQRCFVAAGEHPGDDGHPLVRQLPGRLPRLPSVPVPPELEPVHDDQRLRQARVLNPARAQGGRDRRPGLEVDPEVSTFRVGNGDCWSWHGRRCQYQRQQYRWNP